MQKNKIKIKKSQKPLKKERNIKDNRFIAENEEEKQERRRQ